MNYNKKNLVEMMEAVSDLPYSKRKDVVQIIVDKLSKNSLIDYDLEKSIDKHVVKIMDSYKDKIWALCDWLKAENYNMNDLLEHNAGDRKMDYLGNYSGNDVLYFSNQNMEMVMVLEEGYSRKVHIRLVYPRIENSHCIDVGKFREELKGENGVEKAITTLTSEYHQDKYSDVYPGNEYPSRIDLQTMIDKYFKKGTLGFKYLDERDMNYVYSDSLMDSSTFCGNIPERKYLLDEIFTAIDTDEIPEGYYKQYFRDKKIKEIIE